MRPLAASLASATPWWTGPRYEDGKAWINGTQSFDAVPLVSWDLYIDGYQPAKKWLKDRKGRGLGFEDIQHYQRIKKKFLKPIGSWAQSKWTFDLR